MAGLFSSKKSKKEKEEKAKTAAAAAAAAANASSGAAGGPQGSIASSTSNLPPGATKPVSSSGAPQGHVHGQSPTIHIREIPGSTNNSITNTIGSTTIVASDNGDKAARMYHLQQQQSFNHQYSQQQQQQQQGSNIVSASSISTHNSILSSTGPWISGQVLSASPFPRFSHTASYVHTGTDIYVFGGVVKGSAQRDMHVIDSQSLHCQVLPVGGPDCPPATSGHTAVTLGQYIMYFGGKDAKNKCSDVLYVLHSARKEWNRPPILGLLPAPRHSHAACVIGTTMFIFGGQFNGYYLNDIACFDMKSLNTTTPKWNRLEPASELPPARAGHCAASHDGKVYIFGGADEQFFYNDIWCYDPQTNKWEAVPAFGVLPTSRQGHAASVIDDTMYIYGGIDHEDHFLGDLSAFKFYDRRWLTFPDTPDSASPRSEHAMCSVGEKIYILGGQLEPNAEDDAGSVYILDTTKIRYNEPSLIGSQKSGHDNDTTLRSEATPSPDSHRQILNDPHQQKQYPQSSLQQTNDNHDHQQQQHLQARHPQPQQQPQAPQQPQPQQHHSARFVDDSQVATQSQGQVGLEGTDAPSSVSRRRTLSKPTGYPGHESVEQPIRSTQSIDETRRPTLSEMAVASSTSEFDPQQQLGGNRQRHPYNNSAYPGLEERPLNRTSSSSQQQQQDVIRRRSLSESRNRTSFNPPPRASIDQQRPSSQQFQQQPQQQEAAGGYGQEGSQYSSKDAEIRDLRQREQWLLAEVAMSRKRHGERPVSMNNSSTGQILREEMHAFETDADPNSEKYRIMQVLLAVKAELEKSKTSIVTQAQLASNKLREAERVRTAALQEAAYLKAKVSALQSGETQLLNTTESARAVDLEKRLTVALNQVDRLQSQLSQNESVLERERHARESAQNREQQAASRAEEAQLSHSRSLAELTALHERASFAEANLRECETKNAASEAGLSSYQQQSTALFSQISALKTTVDHQKKSLEKAKLAYSVASERAEHADRLWTQTRQEMDTTQLEMATVQANLDRTQREAEHWKSKAQETELLLQKAKSENEAMRTLLEEDMNASYSPGVNSRKHDSIMAITSASRVAELEHELGTLRHLLRESQSAAAQANKDLGDTMVRISQLEQTSMAARTEAATAQRQWTAAEDRVSSLETQLSRKDETLEDMAKEQENNEVQLGLLRGVMRENGLLADDLIVDALTHGADGSSGLVFGAGAGSGAVTMTSLKAKVQETEKRAQEAEDQLQELQELKQHQEDRIHQLEADYQTAVHYVQGSEGMLQRLRDDAQAATQERDTIQVRLLELESAHALCEDRERSAGETAAATASAQLEEEVTDLHRQLHDSMGRSMELEQKLEEVSRALEESEASTESTLAEFKTLKAKHHEHKKQGAAAQENHQIQLVQFEATLGEAKESLAETRRVLETTQQELELTRGLNQKTAMELEQTLELVKSKELALAEAAAEVKEVEAKALKAEALAAESRKDGAVLEVEEQERRRAATLAAHQEELELVIENAQKTIQSLQADNEDLKEQLNASEKKISILLDNFQGPDSVRNSMASLPEDLIARLMETQSSLPGGMQQALPRGSHLAPYSRGSHLTDRSSADSLANELELLRSNNWGHGQLGGSTGYGPRHHLTQSSPSSSSPPAHAGSPKAYTVSTNAPPAGAHVDVGALPILGSTSGMSGAPAAAAIGSAGTTHADVQESISTAASSLLPGGESSASGSSSNMTSAQKLEEYERMMEDMANVRRQYEE